MGSEKGYFADQYLDLERANDAAGIPFELALLEAEIDYFVEDAVQEKQRHFSSTDTRSLIRQIQNGNDHAKQQLIDRYEPLLVQHYIGKFNHLSIDDQEDLAQEIRKAIYETATKYQIESHIPFSQVCWVNIQRTVAKFLRILAKDHEITLTDLGIDPEEINNMVFDASMLDPMLPGEDAIEYARGGYPPQYSSGMEHDMVTADRIRRSMKVLRPREAEIIKLRYGFDSRGPCTLDEIGKMFHFSPQRVSQYIIRALKIMRFAVFEKDNEDNNE